MVEEKLEFVKRCGLKLTQCREGYIECEMATQGNENHLGSMYAGALFTLAEIPGGALWLSSFDISNTYPVLKAFNIEYLRPAHGTIRFTLEMSPQRIDQLAKQCKEDGKVDFEIEGELVDEQNRIVATSRGQYQLRAK